MEFGGGVKSFEATSQLPKTQREGVAFLQISILLCGVNQEYFGLGNQKSKVIDPLLVGNLKWMAKEEM